MTRYRWYINRDPFLSEFSRLQKEMTRLWDQVYPEERWGGDIGVFPPVNVYEDEDNFYITAEIPGVKKEDLDISVASGSVTIKGERKTDVEGDVNFHRAERSGGTFSRVVSLGEKINPDKVEANVTNGVLTVKMAKAEETKPKQITVKST